MELLERLVELQKQRERAVLITVVEARGSTPRKPGARMLIFPDGRTEGTVGGGKVEHVLRDAATRVLKTENAELVHHNLTTELAMCCGGQMTFFVEPLMTPPTLMVFGCGHVGGALVRIAADLGFTLIGIDDLEENTAPARLPQLARVVSSYEPADLGDLPFGEDTYIVIATREHAIDQRLLEFCLTKPCRYLGVIGSARKAHMQRERLAAKNVPAEQIARITCPMGADIGGETPAEIAVSICAQLIQVRRGGGHRTP